MNVKGLSEDVDNDVNMLDQNNDSDNYNSASQTHIKGSKSEFNDASSTTSEASNISNLTIASTIAEFLSQK